MRLNQSHAETLPHLFPAIDQAIAWSPTDTLLLQARTKIIHSSYSVLNKSSERLLRALSILFDQFSFREKELNIKTSFAISILCEKCNEAIGQHGFPISELVTKVHC